MDWESLISDERLNGVRGSKDANFRTCFQEDYDRIVFSSAFRRLQGKTQVHPFPASDYIHTRLTHSIETASVGRSLGFRVGKFLVDHHIIPPNHPLITPDNLATITASACLIHDIGNTPFGHAGEQAIQDWFCQHFTDPHNTTGLNNAECQDFLHFDGNPQGFRTVTRTQGLRGLNLTLSVLGAALKYPRLSNVPKKLVKNKLAEEKFSVFQSESHYFHLLKSHLNLSEYSENYSHRHPLVYLVEAADDICYNIIDIEDGYKLGALSLAEVEALFEGILGKIQYPDHTALEDDQKVAFLRAKAIGELVQQAAEVFMNAHQSILSGQFEYKLLSQIPIKQQLALTEAFKVSELKIFSLPQKSDIETKGQQALQGLLNVLIHAVDKVLDAASNPSEHHLALKTLQIANITPPLPNSKYELYLHITDFISGMTDNYALELFQKLSNPTHLLLIE